MKFTIKAWRCARGMTQAEFADKCGVHVNTVREWEKNPQSIKVSNAIRVAEVLGITLEDIIF